MYIQLIDSLTFEELENVEITLEFLKGIKILTSDPENTKVLFITKEDE